MGDWVIGVDTLASSRFAVSALAETVGALVSLDTGAAPAGRQDWLRAHRPWYRSWIAADPFAAAVVRAAFRQHWMADFLTMPPADDDVTFADELRRVRAVSADDAWYDLTFGLTAPLPHELRVPDLPDRAADVLERVWSTTVEPEWPRRRRILEADIVARTRQLSTGGWGAVLGGMRPGTRWLGDGRLQINVYDYPPLDLGAAQLLYVPCTTRRGWGAWERPHRFAIVYPCSGTLAEAGHGAPPEALSRLLGPVWAAVLTLLATPMSPSQLVAATGHGLGSVGGHLKVLRDAQLVRRRRSGRAVLYFRTPAGETLVRAAGGIAPGGSCRG